MDKEAVVREKTKIKKIAETFARFGLLYTVCFLIFSIYYVTSRQWGYHVIIALGLLILPTISFIFGLLAVRYKRGKTKIVLTSIALLLTSPNIKWYIETKRAIENIEFDIKTGAESEEDSLDENESPGP